MNSRQRFLAAAQGEPVDRPPLWVMRQAGRYLPEYRALKARYDFLTLAKTPELAAEVTLQPLKRFALDAAILFSDILIIPEALGQPYHFRDQGGIAMDFALESVEQMRALREARVIRERLVYVAEALNIVRRDLGEETALLGFAGSPWTLACYMVEGGSSQDFAKITALARHEPVVFAELMEKLADAVAELLLMKIEHGVDAVQIFDSWGAACPGDVYWDWSLRWIGAVIDRLPASTPVVVYAKGMGAHLPILAKTGASVLSLDWTVDLPSAHDALGGKLAVQGNLDPEIMTSNAVTVSAATKALLDAMGGRHGHIVNLGHGITPDAKIECMQALVDTVVSYRKVSYV